MPSVKAYLGAMPDTSGLNFFETDPNLRFLLKRYLAEEEFQRALPHLSELGEVAGSELDRLSRLADKHPPELIPYNAKGERIDHIEFHPAYREMERIGYSRFGLVAMSHKPGVMGWPTPFPHVLKYAFWYLFAQAEFGLCCPMSMTDSAARVLEKFASPEMQKTYLPRLTSTDLDELWTGAQFMTEKQGGSDVGANSAVAKQVGDHWELWGDKWFCSNASADVALVLARPEGAPAGTKGLGLFLMPKRLPDGSKNRYRINRLKDKLGTRDMASGEVTFEGATAYVVGDITKGFKQMMAMVNSSRLSNAVRSAAMIRRSYLEALVTARGRTAFGKPLAELPLMRETLFELLLDAESSAAMVFYTAKVYDRADAGDEQEQLLLRILTPLLKGYICKRARYATGEAMEARGGNGYIEDWINPRLVRDAHLGSIWEGTTNIVALDILRALSKDGAGEVLFNRIYARISNGGDPLARRVGELLRWAAGKVNEQSERVIRMPSSERERFAKQLMNRLYHVCAASLLLEEAAYEIEQDQSYRKLYLAVQYMHRYLLANGLDEVGLSDQTLMQWFDAIVDWDKVSRDAVEGLLDVVTSFQADAAGMQS